jgi:prepilin-type N-terminal cleavage/methylation domain-containing protein
MGGRFKSRGLGVGFTLIEVLTALAILALTASSVLFVVNQNISSAADSVRRMEAFALARENMERVLTSPSATETVQFGTSEIYPDISWRTVVEAFSEPVEGTMWLRAVCAAEFADSKGETQKVELVHWLSPLTDQQAAQFLQGDEGGSLSAEQIIEGNEDAAKYANVDADTIGQWLDRGLVVTSDGSFLRYNLDIFIRSQGNPSEAARAQQVHSLEELASVLRDTAGEQGDVPHMGPTQPTGDGQGGRAFIDDAGRPSLGSSLRGRPRN